MLLSLGLHWTLLQTVAWTGMVISFSQHATFSEAFSKTFDGRHPCALCKVIQKGQAEEQKRDNQQLKPSVKLDVGVVWQGTDFIFTVGRERTPSGNTILSERQEAPPKPRPRLA